VLFELAAGNLILGRFTFAYLNLPEGWSLSLGTEPDIYRTVTVGQRAWVLEGSAIYFAMDPLSGESYELSLRCQGLRDLRHRGFELLTAGHAGSYSIGELRAGMLRRRTLRRLEVRVPCDVTKRLLELEFTGEGEGLESLLSVRDLVVCHEAPPLLGAE
jgi:hypothetical protein